MVELNNKVHGGRSILDYSLVACFTLILLLGIVVLDAGEWIFAMLFDIILFYRFVHILCLHVFLQAEYISVPGLKGAKGSHHAALEAATGVDILSNDELKELQKQIDDAKSLLASKHDEVQKIVHKVEVAEKEEEEVKTGVHHVDTAEEKKEEEKKEEEIVETVVEKVRGQFIIPGYGR